MKTLRNLLVWLLVAVTQITQSGVITMAGPTSVAAPEFVYDPGYTYSLSDSTYDTARTFWINQMFKYGRSLITSMEYVGHSTELVYYDADWVMRGVKLYRDSIGNPAHPDYPGDPEPDWSYGRTLARSIYFERIAAAYPSAWNLDGYDRFPHGLYYDYLDGRSGAVLTDVSNIRDLPHFSNLSEFTGSYDGFQQGQSREVAYALQANVLAERAGLTPVTEGGYNKTDRLFAFCVSHLQEWLTGVYGAGSGYFKPFMAALTLTAMFDYVEWREEQGSPVVWPSGTRWSSFDEAVLEFQRWMRDTAVVRAGASVGSRMLVQFSNGAIVFRYQDNEVSGGSTGYADEADTAGLITEPYARLAARKLAQGDTAVAEEMMETADRLLVKAMTNPDGSSIANVLEAKCYNQTYRGSIRYMQIKEATGLGVGS